MEATELYAELKFLKCSFNKIVLYNSRKKRNKEKDGITYRFCYSEYLNKKCDSSSIIKNKNIVADTKTKKNIEKGKLIAPSTKDSKLYLFPVRDDLQGIDLNDLIDGVNFLEIYDKFIDALQETLSNLSVQVFRLFIAPFTQNEMMRRVYEQGTDEISVIIDEMKNKISERKKFGLSHEDQAEITKRTDNAVKEIQCAFNEENPYNAILVNPCGEADPTWGTQNTIPVGKAKVVMETLCELINSLV